MVELVKEIEKVESSNGIRPSIEYFIAVWNEESGRDTGPYNLSTPSNVDRVTDKHSKKSRVF